MPAPKIKVHFIGIGGIGVSALARYYLAKGHTVSGSDLVSSEITDDLKKLGATMSIGKNIIPKNADLIIYSPAVNIKHVKHRVSNTLSYPQALGELTKKYFTIAVSGTHGKSSTCVMLALILIKAGLDPTVIVGTKVKEFGNSNFKLGKSKYLVIEACEYDESFLNYYPQIIVITNIEAEHLDYFKSFSNVLLAFKKFAKRLPQNGILIDGKKYKKAKDAVRLRKTLKVPGEYNVQNALAALAVARVLKIPDKTSYRALAEYRGSWRRFDTRKIGQLTIVSDYGHHPTQIKAALKAAREKWPKKKIWCLYQPHQYQRTYYLFNDFVKVFSQAPIDKIIITDIYDVAGREEKNISQKVDSEKLVKAIDKKSIIYLPKNKIITYLKKELQDSEVLIIMGAGDIYQIDKDL